MDLQFIEDAWKVINCQYITGNEHFHQNDLELALDCYMIGIEKFEDLIFHRDWVNILLIGDAEPISKFWQIIVGGLRCYLNGGYCHAKLRNYASAIDANTSVLNHIALLEDCESKHGDDNICQQLVSLEQKALLRRSLAYEYANELHKAKLDLVSLSIKFPNVISGEHNLRIRQLERKIQEDQMIANKEGFPKEMINRNQTLRLMFMQRVSSFTTFSPFQGDSFPSCSSHQMLISSVFSVKLAIGNELGLFHRGLYDSTKTDSLATIRCVPRLACNGRSTEDINIRVLKVRDLLHSSQLHSDAYWGLPNDGKITLHFCCIISLSSEVLQINFEKIISSKLYLEFNLSNFADNGIQVIPVMSLPVKVHLSIPDDSLILLRDIANKSDSKFEDTSREDMLQLSCIRPVAFCDEFMSSTNSSIVYAYESPGLLGIGGKVWDSSFILIAYLNLMKSNLIENKRILELGAGTGVTGIAISFLHPSSILMTDLPPVVPLIEANIDLNRMLMQNNWTHVTNSVTATSFEWGTSMETESIFLSCDTIIASDVVYYPEGYAPLVKTIVSLLTTFNGGVEKNKTMILAHRHRHPQDSEFFDLLYEQHLITVTPIEWKKDLGFISEGSLSDVQLFVIKANHNSDLVDIRTFVIH